MSLTHYKHRIWTMNVNRTLTKLRQLTQDLTEELAASEVPLAPGAVQDLLELQKEIVQLRNEAVKLHRSCGHTLTEVGATFEMSGSRVSQLSRGLLLPVSSRIVPPVKRN